ncbi:hypothetical protein [Planomonospora parontospora]|uniref:hypothetical protein n=1 Tax=Planomonospora parontospora TaxID=58119 RepID=UPI00167157DC|nr:hypothetical protein [Planomonospora parontospora]GGL42544.1 hypothetical protein GCM10014719_49810 [Planomonospora parontospora subsp. antibiotica]GII18380.1 hypothetical protein Ppa05_51060 [Planomonospora parontospora subsp. antibiotica]
MSPEQTSPGKVSPDVEMFQLLAWRWNVTTAKSYAAGRTPDRQLDPATWAGLLSLIVIDEHHAEGVDLAEPVIAVPVPDGGGPLVIDGWHRIHKALTTGVERLPVIFLTAEEELACRIHGGEKGYGWR